MDEIAKEYDVVVLGTGTLPYALPILSPPTVARRLLVGRCWGRASFRRLLPLMHLKLRRSAESLSSRRCMMFSFSWLKYASSSILATFR